MKSSASVGAVLSLAASTLALRINATTSLFFCVVSSGQGRAVYGSGLDHFGAALPESSPSSATVLARFLEGPWLSTWDDWEDVSPRSSSSADNWSRFRNLAAVLDS